MDANSWAAVAAVAAAITALLTLAIAFANTSQTRTANKTADFSNCLAVVDALASAQRRVFEASDDEPRRHREFNELMNLMEALARLHNDDNLTASTRKIVEDFLDEAWAWLQADPKTHPMVIQSITSPDTYKELRKFGRRHGSRRNEHLERFREQIATRDQGGELT